MQLEVTYSVGVTNAAPETVAVLGRPISASSNITRRELGMTITPSAKGGYDCIVRGPTHTSVVLPVSEAEIGDAIKVARDAMMSVVTQRDGAELVFQKGIAIDDASRDRALRTLAVAGADLFQRIFFGPAAAADVQQVGELLKKQATKPGSSLNFQVVADALPRAVGTALLRRHVGWRGDRSRAVPRHAPRRRADPAADRDARGRHGDRQRESVARGERERQRRHRRDAPPHRVAQQLAYWDECATAAGARLTVAPRRTKAELLAALRDGARGPADVPLLPRDHECARRSRRHSRTRRSSSPETERAHARRSESRSRRRRSRCRATRSCSSTPASRASCAPSSTTASSRTSWRRARAASSARSARRRRSSPRSGRSASSRASSMASRSATCSSSLRREFHTKHGNPLGLLYNVYCDADTRIQPGLTI